MLLEGFYTLTNIDKVREDEYEAFIHLHKEHEIFEGHFPNNPVTPGVCMMQILKELTSKIIDKKLIMKSSNNIKFMSLINPEKNPDLKLNIVFSKNNEEEVHIKNTCYFDDTLALKMSIKYSILS